MESKSDVEDYLQDLLDTSNSEHSKFIQELLRKWKPGIREVEQTVPDDVTVSTILGVNKFCCCH